MARDVRQRVRRLSARAAQARRDSQRLRRVPLAAGEVEIDSGLVAAWAFAIAAVAGLVSVGWAVRWVIGAGSGEP